MKIITTAILFVLLISCGGEDNKIVEVETESIPYANKVWYLQELDGYPHLIGRKTGEEFETLQLNEGAGFNSYRIIQRLYADVGGGKEELRDIPVNIGTWSKIEDNILQLNYDKDVLGDMGNSMKIHIISHNNDEFIADIEKFWGSQYGEITQENKGIYKVRAKYVSDKD